jgi:hypothetical protein
MEWMPVKKRPLFVAASPRHDCETENEAESDPPVSRDHSTSVAESPEINKKRNKRKEK